MLYGINPQLGADIVGPIHQNQRSFTIHAVDNKKVFKQSEAEMERNSANHIGDGIQVR